MSFWHLTHDGTNVDDLNLHLEVLHPIRSPPSKKEKSEVEELSKTKANEDKNSNDLNKTMMDLNKTLINPDVSFLTDTALGIAEMLDNLPSGTTDGDKKEEDLEKGELNDYEDKEPDIEELQRISKHVTEELQRISKHVTVNEDEPSKEVEDDKTIENTLVKLREVKNEKLRNNVQNGRKNQTFRTGVGKNKNWKRLSDR